MTRSNRYLLPAPMEPGHLLAIVRDSFITEPGSAHRRNRHFYDTFDWRLYRDGYTLSREAGVYRLNTLADDIERLECSEAGDALMRFWWDFPAGDLRRTLSKILSVRSLIHLVSLDCESRTLRVLSPAGRSMLTFQLDSIEVPLSGREPAVIHVVDLRREPGIKQEFTRFRRFMEGLGLWRSDGSVLLRALAARGLRAGGYSSRPRIQLKPRTTGRQAARLILARLLQIMRQNEAGISADIDTEFLHDWRVAVRRTRSALDQIKGVFPPESIDRFAREFERLGTLSNRLRDLDVNLLRQESYRTMLPVELRGGLDPLFAELAREREREHERLVEEITTGAYRKTVGDWQAFLAPSEPDALPPTKNSAVAVRRLALKYLAKAYRRVTRLGDKIADTAAPADLHRLRIACKKLRYLLEFFASLFTEAEITLLVKQLKRLQDNLGDYNDYRVQQAELAAYLRKPQKAGDLAPVAATVGGLLAVLHERQARVRADFEKAFGAFSSRRTAKAFRSLRRDDD